MWALYGKSECAVALTTTAGQLADTVEGIAEHRISIARVEYVKHWRDPKLDISPDYTRVFAYKTKAYEYEKEVRVIIDRTRGPAGPDLRQPGIVVPIDAGRLLRSIVIAPDAAVVREPRAAVGAALWHPGAGAAVEAGDRPDLTRRSRRRGQTPFLSKIFQANVLS